MHQPFIPLSANVLEQKLHALRFVKPFQLHVLDTISSTNDYLATLTPSDNVAICVAEAQTQGRGRFSRQWHSPYGINVYCSSRWIIPCSLSKLSGLSLVTSLAIVDAIKNTLKKPTSLDDIKIKWPNDILWHGKKLSGNLIEGKSLSNGSQHIIIGIGINVNGNPAHPSPEPHPMPPSHWSSLYEMAQQYVDRNELISLLLFYLEKYIDQLIQSDLSYFIEAWNKVDLLYNQSITLNHRTGTFVGKAKGIDRFGQLIIEDGQGGERYFSSGDSSISGKPI